MRTVVLVLLLVFFAPLQVNAQEGIDWKKEIQGGWKINHPKTSELASQGPNKKFARDLAMIPIASPSIQFTDKTISFATSSESQNYQFKAFDPESKRIELTVENEGRESTIHFAAKDSNTLILDLPASILGPLQIVYSRTKAIGKAPPDSPLSKLTGDWKLEEELTRAMWEQTISKGTLKEYLNVAADELSPTIQILHPYLLYSDQTFEPWNVKVQEGSKILLESTARPQFNIEINKISDDLIQIADGRKRLFAIYSRGIEQKVKAEPRTEFPKNRVADFFLASFSPPPTSSLQFPPGYKPPIKVAPIGIDGNVEIMEVSVRRRQNADAVVNADIINMSIDLFLNSEFKHTSVMGGYLIDLKRLDDVHDNREKLLSPMRRRRSIEYLNSPTRPSTTHHRSKGRTGPSFSIQLDAPELGATEIKRIAGEVKLTGYEPRLIRFENVGLHQNKPLEHPLLKGMDVRPEIKNGKYPKFALKLIQKDRILNWYLVTAQGTILTPNSFSQGNDEVAKGFSSPIPNDVTLVMEVVLTKSSQTMPFEFNNIKLR